MSDSKPRSSKRVQIFNTLGLHLRAADQFVRTARRFQAELTVSRHGKGVNGKSILELTTLAAVQGTWLDLEAHGEDAEAVLLALAELITARFHEDDEQNAGGNTP